MKVIAEKGVTIVYAKKVKEAGRKRQVVDYIPPDRNAFVVWLDQFGTAHFVGFGDVETPDDDLRLDEVVTRALEHFAAPGDES